MSWFRFGQTSYILWSLLDIYRESYRVRIGIGFGRATVIPNYGPFSEGNFASVLFEIWHLLGSQNSISAAYRLSTEETFDFMPINNLQ